jgi:putative transposase
LFKNADVTADIKELFNQIAEKSGFVIDVMEVDLDHIHVLVDAPPALSPTSIATRLKSQSTFHIWKKHDILLQYHFWKEKTFWSDGYFACTTGNASTETIKKYIEEQG